MNALNTILHTIGKLFRWFVIVAPWQQGIRVRLGRRQKRLDPGWYIVIPFIDRVYIQCTRARSVIVHQMTVTTQDGHIATVAGYYTFNVANIVTLYQTLQSAEDVLSARAAQLITEYVQSSPLASMSPKQLKRFVDESMNAEAFGLGNAEFSISTYAIPPRTIRLMMGEPRQWTNSGSLDTDSHVHQSSGGE